MSESLKMMEKAIDKRFQKNQSFYISKEDIEKVKQAIENNETQNLNIYRSKLGTITLVHTIIKNNWLINLQKSKSKRNDIIDLTKSLLNSLDNEQILEITKDVSEDKIFSSILFKETIEKIRLPKLPVAECSKMALNNDQKLFRRSICLQRYLLDLISKENFLKITNEISQYLFNDENLLNYIKNHNTDFLKPVVAQMIVKYGENEVAKWFLANIQVDNNSNRLLEFALIDLGQTGFNHLVNYINNNPRYTDEKTKYLIKRVLSRFYKLPNFEQEMVNLFRQVYKQHNSASIFILHMFEPPTFKNKEIAQRFVAQIKQFHLRLNAGMEKVFDKIEHWTSESNGFDSIDEFLDEVKNSNNALNNNGLLAYVDSQLSKTSNKLVNEIIKNVCFNEDYYKQAETMSLFLANHLALIEGRENKLTDECKENIGTIMLVRHMFNSKVRAFLIATSQLDKLEKLERR